MWVRTAAYRGGIIDVGADGPVVERHGRSTVACQLCHRLLSVQPFLELPQRVQLKHVHTHMDLHTGTHGAAQTNACTKTHMHESHIHRHKHILVS